MLRRKRKSDAVLPEVVASGDLPAKAVTPTSHEHLAGLIGIRVDQDRHVETRHADGICHSSLLTEIRQAYDDAVDLVGVFPKEVRAFASILQSFDGAEFGAIGGQTDCLITFLLEDAQSFFATVPGQ